jgi:CheY-like chemotaxis protein
MPGKGGYWLIGQVRALPAEDGGATPAVALTAYTSPEHCAAVLRAGFQVHVAKPVGVAELIDVVASLAASRATRGVDAASSTR